MRRASVMAALGVAVLAAGILLPAGAEAARRCSAVRLPEIHATNVQTFGGLSCTTARRLLRRYFNTVLDEAQVDGGCAQVRHDEGCEIGAFTCFVTDSRTQNGRCTDGERAVRFYERDRGSQ